MEGEDSRLPLDGAMCIGQFVQMFAFIEDMQGDGRIETACDEAMTRCRELFEEFYSADDRTECLLMLGYLAMNITANVSYTLDRAAIVQDMN